MMFFCLVVQPLWKGVLSQRRRALALCLLMGLSLILGGCSRGTPKTPLTALPSSTRPSPVGTPAPLDFRLAQPIGTQTSIQAQTPFTITFENCSSSVARTQPYTGVLTLPPDYMLTPSAPPEGVQAEAGVIAAAVRALYGLDRERTAKEHLEIAAPPAARALYRVHWEEIWDDNTLQVRRGEDVIEALGVSALIGARLVTETVTIEPCPQQAEGGSGLAGDAEDASALVSAYLERLGKQDYEGAYVLLAADYRRQVPFDRYLEGYEPVAEMAVSDVQTTHVEPAYAIVEAHLTIGLRRQGQIVSSPWLATYYLVRQAMGESWAWAIADVVMLPTSPMLAP
ncbi:MAG: hypothetical protein H5T66_04030 [Chloroflexi bacterium]|nr:hypothetical protein [Chloroflexota bacterium]